MLEPIPTWVGEITLQIDTTFQVSVQWQHIDWENLHKQNRKTVKNEDFPLLPGTQLVNMCTTSLLHDFEGGNGAHMYIYFWQFMLYWHNTENINASLNTHLPQLLYRN